MDIQGEEYTLAPAGLTTTSWTTERNSNKTYQKNQGLGASLT